jgi:uncharacterized protein YuzE
VAYLELSDRVPEGATELTEGVILHTTATNEIVGIEILDASARFPLQSLFRYELIEGGPARRVQT